MSASEDADVITDDVLTESPASENQSGIRKPDYFKTPQKLSEASPLLAPLPQHQTHSRAASKARRNGSQVFMKQFIDSRPLSVLIAFAFAALDFLSSLTLLSSVPGMLETQRSMHSLIANGFATHADLAGSLSPLMPLYAVASALIPLVVMAAFYQSSHLGFKALCIGSGAGFILGCLAGFFPVGGLVLNSLLLSWMAFELYGFNVVAWAEARVTSKVTPEAVTSEVAASGAPTQSTKS